MCSCADFCDSVLGRDTLRGLVVVVLWYNGHLKISGVLSLHFFVCCVDFMNCSRVMYLAAWSYISSLLRMMCS